MLQSFICYSYILSLLLFHPCYEENRAFTHAADNQPAPRTASHTHSREQESWLTPKTDLPTVEISSENNDTIYLLPLQHCKGLPYILWERHSEKDKGQLP